MPAGLRSIDTVYSAERNINVLEKPIFIFQALIYIANLG